MKTRPISTIPIQELASGRRDYVQIFAQLPLRFARCAEAVQSEGDEEVTAPKEMAVPDEQLRRRYAHLRELREHPELVLTCVSLNTFVHRHCHWLAIQFAKHSIFETRVR